ncbi:hypothetical protein Rsub_04866 [Raphidocelis subcapitata]|uniref:Uncharacterized protein n=1 Tax=Raphidocelis subcapitata TaxID=307507 RepID=A0A2V0P1X4_9CHLO|nr:hypothetical protein Rsub_04866 [Raphidocelis subcapitata]|eukprot:GBF91197.1 hypothetical protein Rsub_04866 [Raphidocelis subcapitata]
MMQRGGRPCGRQRPPAARSGAAPVAAPLLPPRRRPRLCAAARADEAAAGIQQQEQQQQQQQEASQQGSAGAAAASTAPSRRSLLGAGAAATAAGAGLLVAPGSAGAVQTVVLRDGTAVEAYEHGMSLSIVALRGSVPTQWVLDFRQGLGRYAGFELGQRGQLQEIFNELGDPKAKRSAGAADVVTLGDAWLGPAAAKGLIQPIPSAETYRWWRRLPRRWQQLVRRGPDGRPSDCGAVWGCPYRWGGTLIAYRKDSLLRRGGRPIRDWSDLLQPQLRGKIAFSESSREFVGIALKTLSSEARDAGRGGARGASEAAAAAAAAALGFNATPAALAAAGVTRAAARARTRELLAQARAFSDRDHVRTLMAGDTLAVVGTSEDLVPLAERTPSLELVAPASGTALWADVWCVPAAASGGHLKVGPSPLLPAWLEFGVLPARAAALGSLRTGATPLLLPSPPPPPHQPRARRASADGDASARRRGPLGWLRSLRGGGGRSGGGGGGDGQCHEPPAPAPAPQLPPPSPDDALLAGPRGYLPSDPVLLRSEFLLPLSDEQRELYAWMLGRDGPKGA